MNKPLNTKQMTSDQEGTEMSSFDVDPFGSEAREILERENREAARYVVNTGDGREIVGLRLKEAIQLAGMSNGSWFKADGGPKHQPICYEATVCNCDVDFGRPLTALEMASRTS